jgi:hypothetical protein
MNSPFLASAISRQDGSPADGIHLLWTAPPRISYSIDGFDIQRRPAERREVLCYSLTDQEIATLHETFRVRVPPGLVRVRRTKCPQFPQQAPDEPAPLSGGPAEDLRTDFRKLPKGTGANPRTERTGAYVVRSAGGRTAAQTTIRSIGAHVGLDCGFRLQVDLPEAVEAVELLMVRFAHAPRVTAFRHDGSTAATASMSGPEGQPQTIVLKGASIRRFVVEAPQNELLLLEVGLVRASETGSHGQPSRFPQPPFGLGEVSSPSRTLAVIALPACRVYDIRLNDAHLTVRVSAKLPAMLAIAMRDGKAVSTGMLSAAGGEQSAFFQNQIVDQVLLYATTAAASLVICTDRLGSPEYDDAWKQVPLLAKNIHVPVRSVNAALGSVAAEDALGSSRLLPGESFDAAAFHDVATLMNDSSLDAAQTPPPARSVLTRETLNDPLIEIHGWQYALSLLVEADWRRMLGFGYFDKGAALTSATAYDYRITGRFRRRELHEKLLGFHTIPLGTALPAWFQFDSVLVETPQPAAVDMFPAPPENSLRAVGTKGIALAPQGGAGQCLSVTFQAPTRKAVFEFEPSAAQGLHFRAKTTDYIAGLTGTIFSGAVPLSRRVTLEFAEPVDTVTFFGAGFFYGVRMATDPAPPGSSPDDVVAASVTIPGVRYEPTPEPLPPPFLGTTNLQQPQLPGDPAVTTEDPPQHLGFRMFWIPPPAGGSTIVPWPPDLATVPPFDVLGFHLERRRVDTSGPFVDFDDATPPTRVFGNRSSRRDPPQLYPGIDLMAVFPEEVQPEPPVSVLMDADDTLLSPARPVGPPPGSLHQYRIFSVDAIGRRSAAPTLGSIVRLEKRLPPPLPVGPTTPAPPGVQRPVGVTARVLQPLDPHVTASDAAILGASSNAIVLEWAWTAVERARDPFAKEFRVYFRPVPPDVIQASLTGPATPVGAEIEMAAALNQPIAADALKGRYVRSGESAFKVAANTAGQNDTLRFERSALDPAALPVPGDFDVTMPPGAPELRPEGWPERVAVVPIIAEENYQFVFRDRVAPSAAAADVRVWVGVSAADDQAYIPDALDSAVPNGGRPGNESSIVALAAHARYLDRPVFTVPSPLPEVPEQVTNEPADDRVTVTLDIPSLLPAVSIAPGFTITLERISVDALLNRASAQADDTIGVLLPSGVIETYTLANPVDHAAFLDQIRSAESRRVEGRFVMDLLIRNLAGLEPLWEAALPAPVAFAQTLDTLPAKAERYVHRIRLIDEAGHVSAGAAILPQLVRVPLLASPVSPSLTLSGGSSGTLALAARVRDSFDLKWLVLFTLSQDDTEAPDKRTLEKPQLLRLPSRRDLYPMSGIRLRLADGTLLEPAAALDVATGTFEVPDRLFQIPIDPGFEKRVSVWMVAMTRDGITSRLAGPQTAFTGAEPLVLPQLTVQLVSGVDQASWGALAPGVEAAVERSVDAQVTWARVTPWTTDAAAALPRMSGGRDYRLQLRASHGRRASGAAVHLA